jgi:HWE histidine kinase
MTQADTPQLWLCTLATIQSIISFQLRDDPQIRDAILSRLTALSATDDLIMATQGQGAGLRGILSAELRPYGVSRVSMEGPDVLLPPKLALMMALLVHELATNAANTVRCRVRWVTYQSSGRLPMHDWTLNGVKAADQLSLPPSIAVLERDYFHVPLGSLAAPLRRLLQRQGLFAN